MDTFETAAQCVYERAKACAASRTVATCVDLIKNSRSQQPTELEKNMLENFMRTLNAQHDPRIAALAQQLTLLQSKNPADWQKVIDWR